MLIDEWLRRHDGVAHTSDLYAVGFSKHAVSKAVASGRMLRVRRSWIARRDCDPAVLAAIAAGGRVTCISEAKRMGLWAPHDPDVHVWVPRSAGRLQSAGVKPHWSRGPAPTARRTPVEPLLNVLDHVARCQDAATALAVWESALNKRLVHPDVLHRVMWSNRRAQRLADIASSLSDSGMETEFVILMRAIGVTVRQQVMIDGRRVDGLIGDRLVVQLDGFAFHSDAASRRRDLEADARLRLRGYTVLRFDFHQVFIQRAYVQETVRTAIAQGLHRS